MGGGSKEYTAGYRYYFGIHMGIGRGPVDVFREIKVGDRTAWSGRVTSNATVNINAYDLFGGEEKEGGVQGPLELMFGEPDQIAPSGLRAMIGNFTSGYRRMFTVFFNGLIGMNNPYPKPWKFRFGRVLKGWDGPVWYPDRAKISLDFLTGDLGEADLVVTNFNTVDWQTTTPARYIFISGGVSNDTDATSLDTDSYRYVGDAGADQPVVQAAVNFSHIIQRDRPGLAFVLQMYQALTTAQPEKLTFYPQAPVSADPSFRPMIRMTSATRGTEDFIIDTPRLSPGIDYRLQVSFQAVGGARVCNYVLSIVDGPTLVIGAIPMNPGLERPYLSTPGILFEHPDLESTVQERSWVYYSRFEYGGADVDLAAMNPAHIIYECLTNREWGRGLARSKLDDTSFRAAADRLFLEDFGLCIRWTRTDEIETFVQSVLDHIGATLFVSRTTGLLTLRLIRSDYDIDTIPFFDDESGLLEVSDAVVGSTAKTVNSVSVSYRDPLTDEERSVTVSNPAALIAGGGVANSVSKKYPGIPYESLALRVAQRDLRAASVNLRRFTIVLDRRGEDIEPGSVIAIRDNKRGIPRMAVRVGRVSEGSLLDGRITLEVIQDVFGLPDASFAAYVSSSYAPPDTRPCIAQYRRVIEAPYFLVARNLSAAELDYVNPEAGYMSVMSQRGKPLTIGVRINRRLGAATPDDFPSDDSYLCDL